MFNFVMRLVWMVLVVIIKKIFTSILMRKENDVLNNEKEKPVEWVWEDRLGDDK
jgi:hypothetical protein